MARHVVRFCRPDDVPQVMAFIDRHFRAGHPLAVRRDLFDWQYRDEEDPSAYSMVVALDATSAELLGVLGFVDSKRYDRALAAANCVWLALWQVKPDAGIPSLGMTLFQFLEAEVQHTSLAVSGIRPVLKPLYRAMGFQVTQLTHHFMLNPGVDDYRIAIIPPNFETPAPGRNVRMLRLCRIGTCEGTDQADISVPARTPTKSWTYFKNRYARHPFYDYLVFRIVRAGMTVGLLAARIVVEREARVMRIVDVVVAPEDLSSLGEPLHDLMVGNQCEYVDAVHTGLDEQALHAAGFARVTPDSTVIIPNYFEPFVRENSPILACFRTTEATPFIVCKADGDQDRPNSI